MNSLSVSTLVLLALIASSTIQARGDDNVKSLESLIGSWKCETKSAAFRSDFRWILDRTFIEHNQTVLLFGKTHQVREVIGWDPASKSIKGWIFSRDWIANSTYSRLPDNQGWVIEVVLTRTGGATSRKHKTISVVDGKMAVRTDAAPLEEFLELEFVRESAKQYESDSR